MSTDRRPRKPRPEDSGEAAAEVGVPLDMLLSSATQRSWQRLFPAASSARLVAGLARHPRRVAGEAGSLIAELGRVAAGRSAAEPHPKDPRFSHPAWAENGVLRRSVQAHLALGSAAESLVAAADLDEFHKQRVTLATSNLIDATAPSNNPFLSPVARRAAMDTKGASLARGARNLVRDLSEPPRIPRMVEPDAFTVGETIAATPGAVVVRSAVFELLQYMPTTATVRQIPLVIVPPVINKFYVVDMSPGRSLVEYLVGQGHQVFVISWRNPDVRHADWGFDVYGKAIVDAVAAARDVAGAPSAAIFSLCSGGILASMTLAHLAERRQLGGVSSIALSVSVLDQSQSGLAGSLLTPGSAEAAVRASTARGYLDGRVLAELFAWMRPKELIWNYWVDSYLMGKSPRPFDVLFWNADTTRMTAGLHRDFIALAQSNGLIRPGAAAILGSPVDLGSVHIDSYVTAGITDHLCPWQACYATTQLFGGKSRFVLSTAGHVASIVNPPTNPKASFRIAETNPPDPEDWLSGAEQCKGSWWPDYSQWLHARTGELVEAPTDAGGAGFPVLGPAPGTYVLGT